MGKIKVSIRKIGHDARIGRFIPVKEEEIEEIEKENDILVSKIFGMRN